MLRCGAPVCRVLGLPAWPQACRSIWGCGLNSSLATRKPAPAPQSRSPHGTHNAAVIRNNSISRKPVELSGHATVATRAVCSCSGIFTAAGSAKGVRMPQLLHAGPQAALDRLAERHPAGVRRAARILVSGSRPVPLAEFAAYCVAGPRAAARLRGVCRCPGCSSPARSPRRTRRWRGRAQRR
jgi:hypothetical protein